MKYWPVLLVIFNAGGSWAQQTGLPASEKIRLYVDSSTISDDPDKRMAYGLSISAPWADGGSVFVNLPEHLEYMPGTKGIARHHDKRKNVWQITDNGAAAYYEVESLTAPGVFFKARANVADDRVNFEITIANKADISLKSIRPLFCFQYHHLKGFPLALTDNFDHTFIMAKGKMVAVSAQPVKTPSAIARMAQVADCRDEHNWWAEEMGGMIRTPLDKALTALTSSKDDRKIILSWTPGKNLLTNAYIPCIHADPCIGDLEKGQSRTVKGVLIFTRSSLSSVIGEMAKQ